MRRWAVLEIGRNSVSPWTRPRTMASRADIAPEGRAAGRRGVPPRGAQAGRWPPPVAARLPGMTPPDRLIRRLRVSLVGVSMLAALLVVAVGLVVWYWNTYLLKP